MLQTAELDYRLQVWARWYQSLLSGSLGYSNSPLASLIETGIAIGSTGPKPLPINEVAEEMDAAIRTLRQHNTDLSRALVIYYTGQGPLRQRGKVLGISHRCFMERVNAARQWLTGWLSAKAGRSV
jgi:hypothetical protein